MIWRPSSLEKTLMVRTVEGNRRRGGPPAAKRRDSVEVPWKFWRTRLGTDGQGEVLTRIREQLDSRQPRNQSKLPHIILRDVVALHRLQNPQLSESLHMGHEGCGSWRLYLGHWLSATDSCVRPLASENEWSQAVYSVCVLFSIILNSHEVFPVVLPFTLRVGGVGRETGFPA